jgi:protein gp37
MFTDKKRYGQTPDVVIRSAAATFNAPLKWAKNREKYGHINRVFVDSWSDFFIEEADAWRAEAWAIIRQTPNLTYQLCTKRPERIAACLPADWGTGYPNVWLMVTAENQPMADLRIPILLSIPAAVHGVSVEPMVGPVDLENLPSASGIGRYLSALSNAGVDAGALIPNKLDWVICGGESGPNARPMQAKWAQGLRDQCAAAGVAFFFKQWGEWLGALQDGLVNVINASDEPVWVGKQKSGAILDGREWKEFPAVTV